MHKDRPSAEPAFHDNKGKALVVGWLTEELCRSLSVVFVLSVHESEVDDAFVFHKVVRQFNASASDEDKFQISVVPL